MGTAAYKKKVNVGPDGAVWNVAPATSASLNNGQTALDDTDMTTTGTRSRLMGIKDWSVSLTLNWSPGDAAFTAVKTAFDNRTDLHVQYLPDGQVVNGFQGTGLVESFNLSGGMDDLETVEVTIQANGALGASS